MTSVNRPYDRTNKRVMTSAIDNMSVADVRKFLGECRKKYTSQSQETPMYLTDTLTNGMQLQEFALKFQQGHHQKRHNKSRKHNPNDDGSSSENDEDDYYDTYNCSESDDDETMSPIMHSSTQQSKQSQPISNSTGLSNTLAPIITKKRGRPPKKEQEKPIDPPREKSQHHSRSLMDFIKKPSSKKVKI